MFEDIDLPSLLKTLDPKARNKLRRVLIHDLIDFLIAALPSPFGDGGEGWDETLGLPHRNGFLA